jgi:p-aminobenzoyl-glutamate transporter AbgT
MDKKEILSFIEGTTMKIKTITVTTIVILIFICMMVLYFFYGTPWGRLKAKAEFQSHLQSKYSESMVIEYITFDFMHGKYHAFAHPTMSLTFVFM